MECSVALHAGVGSLACFERKSTGGIVPVDSRDCVLSFFIAVRLALVAIEIEAAICTGEDPKLDGSSRVLPGVLARRI